MSTSSTANSLVSTGRNGRPPGTPSHVSERRRDMHTAALSRSMYSSSSRSLPPPPQWQRNRLGCVGGANSTVGSIGSLVSNMSSLSLPFMISRSESTTVQINVSILQILIKKTCDIISIRIHLRRIPKKSFFDRCYPGHI